MILGKKVIVVLPAFNAAKTLEQTCTEISMDIVDEIILVDDKSEDDTVSIAEKIGIKTIIVHDKNMGYGANQKSCYNKALELDGDIIIMLHPDYQYNPALIPSMAYLIAAGTYDVVLGSRILGGNALKGGMPLYKFISNRFLTLFQNIILGEKLSEYHTGYRAYASDVLRRISFNTNSDDFIFDNELLCQIIYHNFKIAEITSPARYFKEASSINFTRSLKYGLGVIKNSFVFSAVKAGIIRSKIFK
jgi:glycosyltransferase involved in cell wall biosynthesis